VAFVPARGSVEMKMSPPTSITAQNDRLAHEIDCESTPSGLATRSVFIAHFVAEPRMASVEVKT
jgi:hypothetical protein